MAMFTRLLAVTGQDRILDLGGDASTWESFDPGQRVTLVNLDASCVCGHLASVVADAVTVPFTNRAFDVVFSNSVIEHLGTEQRQRAFAAEVRRLSRKGYFVQTPNKWFPIEPHYLAPFLQFVPKSIKPTVIRWATPRGWLTRPSRVQCTKMCEEIRLLDARGMSQLFPEAKIVREHFLGFTKSIIAIWQDTDPACSGRPLGPH
ncbi:MAG: class I SAM-dependent methyltransferase [Candidatus Acidiferrales bacterium]